MLGILIRGERISQTNCHVGKKGIKITKELQQCANIDILNDKCIINTRKAFLSQVQIRGLLHELLSSQN